LIEIGLVEHNSVTLSDEYARRAKMLATDRDGRDHVYRCSISSLSRRLPVMVCVDERNLLAWPAGASAKRRCFAWATAQQCAVFPLSRLYVWIGLKVKLGRAREPG
jgi:hypothetical protein